MNLLLIKDDLTLSLIHLTQFFYGALTLMYLYSINLKRSFINLNIEQIIKKNIYQDKGILINNG